MTFEEAHQLFIQQHLDQRTGERRSRLERGHRHAEKLFAHNIWWPLRHSFTGLHPEYEVMDWRGRSYFADYMWSQAAVKLIIEIKGFHTHVKDMDRTRFCNELNRETFLQSIGFQVISFAYDDVEQRPKLCISLLRSILNRHQPSSAPVSRMQLIDREIVLLTFQLARPIRPIDVEAHYRIDHKTAVRWLKRLCAKGWLVPSIRGRGERIVSYELGQDAWSHFN